MIEPTPIYVVMMSHTQHAMENHVSGVFSTPEAAQAHCDRKNEWAAERNLSYAYAFHTRGLDAPGWLP